MYRCYLFPAPSSTTRRTMSLSAANLQVVSVQATVSRVVRAVAHNTAIQLRDADLERIAAQTARDDARLFVVGFRDRDIIIAAGAHAGRAGARPPVEAEPWSHAEIIRVSRDVVDDDVAVRRISTL